LADATISSITDDEASLSFSNATPGYQPAVGDQLTSTKTMSALPPPPPHSGFNVIALFIAAGGALLAIGHHGQPAVPCTGCFTAPPSSPPFVILNFQQLGQPPTGTITFTFSQPVNSTSQTGIAGNSTYADFSLQPIGGTATTPPAPLSSFGQVSFDTTGTVMTLGEQGSGLVTGEGYEITFTTLVTSTLGQALGPPFTTGINTFSIFKHSVHLAKPKVGPVAPGPVTPGKPGNPKNPPSAPKPPPANPPIPH